MERKSQVYLWEPFWKQAVAVYLDKLPIRIPAGRGVYVEMKRTGVAAD